MFNQIFYRLIANYLYLLAIITYVQKSILKNTLQFSGYSMLLLHAFKLDCELSALFLQESKENISFYFKKV